MKKVFVINQLIKNETEYFAHATKHEKERTFYMIHKRSVSFLSTTELKNALIDLVDFYLHDQDYRHIEKLYVFAYPAAITEQDLTFLNEKATVIVSNEHCGEM